MSHTKHPEKHPQAIQLQAVGSLYANSMWHTQIVRIYAATGSSALAMTLWQTQILSLYLFAISGDTRLVGVAEGAQGASRLLFAVVAGVLIDACPRNTLLTATALFGLSVHAWIAALIVFPPATWHVDRMQLWCASLPVYAIYASLQMTLTDCVFADSVPSGDRVTPYTRRNMLRSACMAVAPLVQLALFFSLGTETWDEATLRPVMLCGVGIGAFSALCLASLDQRRTLGAASDALHLQRADGTRSLSTADGTLDAALLRDVASPCGCRGPGLVEPSEAEVDAAGVAAGGEGPLAECADDGDRTGGGLPQGGAADLTPAAENQGGALVRWTILCYDFVRVCSGGLVVKYWGLFFAAEYSLSPAALALLQLAVFAAMFALTFIAGRLCTDGHRRGTVCMFLLLVCDAGNFVTACVHSFSADAAGWVAREGTLNAVLGLKRSLLMDHTPKGTRGRWNAVESLQSGFWSGTALAGGFIIHACTGERCLPGDHHGYRTTFLAMAGGFVLASVAWTPLIRFR